ncbi:hypothetical protein [Winogradskyella sp. PE311]|uniref:hypothetical protein n=1 Tax=Winogradskyella sp. PE311 TaxID=3366943 RepID=UPI003980F618
MINLLVDSTDMGWYILLLVFLAICLPVILFIIGIVVFQKNKKRGKIILISAAVYSIISLGLCSGFISF